MQSKGTPKKWQQEPFTKEEMDVVKDVWRQLVEDQKLVFGKRPPSKSNMDRLVKELKRVDEDFKINLTVPLLATSKKYNALIQWVARKSKKQGPETFESSE